jgi:hypothetical protein
MVCKFLRKSFPDVAITIEDLVVEGDKIVNRYILAESWGVEDTLGWFRQLGRYVE